MKEIKVQVKEIRDRCKGGLKVGDTFYIIGNGRIRIPDNITTCIYALGSMIPFLTSKLAEEHLPHNSWIRRRKELTCPMDGTVIFSITSK